MSMEMADAIRQLTVEKGYTEEQVLTIIENMLKAAYKRTFGTNANAVVKFNEDNTDVEIYARKVIVDGVYDPVTEIELEEALELSSECEVGDEIDILIDPKNDFQRSAVQTGKQNAHQSLSEIQKDSLLAEYKDKVGEIIIGYYQRERNGGIYVDLGKVEGYLPVKFQSPREVYRKGDRIKALIVDMKKTGTGLQLILSRTDPELVRMIVELEVPEIYDRTVEIFKIVREPGYRIKIAVYSNKEDIDPVGACVGLKGVRIQNVIRELEGEKIDIMKYDSDPRVFIKNALSPAEVDEVFILDEEKKQALAIVNDSQFSLAIGKQGLNVRLANRLVDWNIDVKTADQCEELESLIAETRRAAEELFSDVEYNEIATVSELPDIDKNIADILKENKIDGIEAFVKAYDNAELADIDGVTKEDLEKVMTLIEENVEFVDEEELPEESVDNSIEEEVEEYECPECGATITLDMTSCPSCGIGLSFEYEDE
ncbi:MAG: transcription termination/antitermination protein NusA [Treponema sp.]|nr:transcription termination/antitermination protein NusA [Treponema sp.]